MDIRLRRDQLATELTLLQGIVERRTTIPILSHVLLEALDGKLNLAATDLDVSLSTSCEAETTRGGGLAVQARKFSEIVRSLDGDEVHLEEEETHSLTIRCGRSRFRIRGLDPASFPSLPQVASETAVEIPPAILKRLISKVIFAVSAEESRFQLGGALFKVKPGGLELVATDGYRLALVEATVESISTDDSVLVPRKALAELLRFEGEGPLLFARGEHHLSFRLGGRELTCRILEGSFPDYEQVISRQLDREAVVDRAGLLAAVQRVALLTGERGRAVRLSFGDDEVAISAANPDLGDALEQVPCPFDGEAVQIGLNPDYLGHFLAAAETENVRLEIKDADSQCVGYPVDGADARYLCVIMPMRV